MTDANLILGRLIPDYFPKIFGKSAREPLDAHASRSVFEALAQDINQTYNKNIGLDEIVYGLVQTSHALGEILLTDFFLNMFVASSRSPTRPCAAPYARSQKPADTPFTSMCTYRHRPCMLTHSLKKKHF